MTNGKLERFVEAAINAEPNLDGVDILVVADNGTVTLAGVVGTYAERAAAERAAYAIFGVRTVVNDLHVRLEKVFERARASALSLEWNSVMALRHVDGWVTFQGRLDRRRHSRECCD